MLEMLERHGSITGPVFASSPGLTLSASFRNPSKVAGLKTTVLQCFWGVFSWIERQCFFLLRMDATSVQRRVGQIGIRFDTYQDRAGSMRRQVSEKRGLQTGRFRWFSNRR